MKRLLSALAPLTSATAAQAHTTGIPHEGDHGVAWALALILFAGLVALFAER
ncbi:MAG: hypothetical protein AAGA06_06165 [Pseudomonadota bacterium]